MKIEINNIELDLIKVTYDDIRYGELGVVNEPYIITLSINEFIDLFENEYNEYVKECERDDSFLEEPDIPELSKLSYPLLSKSLKYHKSLVSFLLIEFIAFNFYNCIFKSKDKSKWEFVIVNMESVEFLDENVIIKGLGERGVKFIN